MDSLVKFCQQEVFQVLHPAKVKDQLGERLTLIDGGAGTLKTSCEGVELVRKYLGRALRVLCDAPTVVARQNLARALHAQFSGKVRVVGQSRLSSLEQTLTLNALIGRRMSDVLSTMFSLCNDFNKVVAEFIRVLLFCPTTRDTSLVDSSDVRCSICDQHDDFIRARENLEAIEFKTRQEIVAETPIVIGTSGVFMKPNLKSSFNLGAPFGALVTDECSMPEAGEEICKMMNLVQQGIVLADALKVFIGDVTQEGPSGNTQVSCWTSAEYIRYTSLASSILSLIFSSLKSLPPQDWLAKVVFVNAIRPSHRIGFYAADLINAIADQEILTDRPWVEGSDKQSQAKVRRLAPKVEVERDGQKTSPRPPLRGSAERTSVPIVFDDAQFYKQTAALLEADWLLGHSRYCMVGTFIAALMMLRCGALAPDMQGSESEVNVVLASGSYRAQCIIVCHCAHLLLQSLSEERKQVIMKRSNLKTGTTTSQQSSTTRDTVVLWPVLLNKHSKFSIKPQKLVNVLSRHTGVLCLIRPYQSGTVSPEVQRFYDLLSNHAFRLPAQGLNMNELVCDVLGTNSQSVAKAWVANAFTSWEGTHADLRTRLASHTLPTAVKLVEEAEDHNFQSIDLPAACSASAEVGLPDDSTGASAVPEVSRDIWNFLEHAIETLIPGFEDSLKTVVVSCNKGCKDFKALQQHARTQFETEVDKEFPVGKRVVGIVLDVTVNYYNWKTTPYLYACLVGQAIGSEWQQCESFRMTMELLLFKCASIVTADADLATRCCQAFQADTCSCILVWKLHKLDLDTDGSVVKKLEGAGGRVDFHIVASCRFGVEVVHHDVGYIYHTTNWRQNTYHASAPPPDCTRALVVCSNTLLEQAFRHAVAKAWLSLCDKFCVAERHCLHPDDFFDDVAEANAAPGAQASFWVFPPVSEAGATKESHTILQNIMRQCYLFHPDTSSKAEKRKTVNRLVLNWHPDKAAGMAVDSNVRNEVTAWLLRWREIVS